MKKLDLEATLRALIAELVAEHFAAHSPAHKRPANDDGLLTTRAAAKFANVTPGTIRRWIRKSHLTRHEAVNGRVRIRRIELERYLNGVAIKETPAERARKKLA